MSLLSLLKDPRARKIFGKREMKIIEKQMFGLNLTQSEKNRLSRSIRVKLSFIKDISKFESDFELIHGTKVKEIINSTLEIIKNDFLFYNISQIILFGSTVSRKRHLESDIDIAVKFKDISFDEATRFRIRVMSKIKEGLDLQVYNVLPDKLKIEIDKSGRVLFQK
ncbi:MAG: nucleotidyltransferase domain-containing protein [Nanoarchaeota archaeon]